MEPLLIHGDMVRKTSKNLQLLIAGNRGGVGGTSVVYRHGQNLSARKPTCLSPPRHDKVKEYQKDKQSMR